VSLFRVLIFVALAIILGIPFALRPASPQRTDADVPRLIVVTPHVQQIRHEMGEAFARWHLAEYGSPVQIDWRTPGGTSEIIKQLEAQYIAALKGGRYAQAPSPDGDGLIQLPPGSIGFDLMLGGGSYDHGRLKKGVRTRIALDGQPRDVHLTMSEPAGFPQSQLEQWYGQNKIGAQLLYDPDQYWLGTALSSFGIVYSRDVLAQLKIPEPRSFADLTDPRYQGWIALADPRQSGSITTAFEAILNNEGWDRGWRILREMTANARYYTNSSTKPPIDVSAGEAAAGLAIDFYGRTQGQSILLPGQSAADSRVAYIDPPGEVYIDADPVSLLRGGPNPDLARRFIAFTLTEEAQALWQFPAIQTSMHSAENPLGPRGERMGPQLYELRRMPVRRVMYERYMPSFVDQVNPFEIAADTPPRGWRPALGIMMGAFAIDTAREQRAAWRALDQARSDPGLDPDRLAAMEAAFYAWPQTSVHGQSLPFTPENFAAIEAAWRNPEQLARLKIEYTRFFSTSYRRVLELAR
jgi:iron(III) transport system substrate-binding protein